MGNYRLISLLSWVNKIFETIINTRLNKYLTINSILCNNQFGFRKNSNTLIPLGELVNYLYTAVDNGKFGCCLFLDIAKAFDVLKHDILILKMEKIGIPKKITNLFKSYLSNRFQYI